MAGIRLRERGERGSIPTVLPNGEQEHQEESRGAHRRWPRILAESSLLLAALIVLASAIAAADLMRFAQAQVVRILRGVTIAGVDVGGMHRQEAIVAVEEAFAEELEHTVTLWIDDRMWTVSRRDLGATTTATAAVDRALESSAQADWPMLAGIRWRQDVHELALDVDVSDVESEAAALVAGLADEVALAPRDAELHWNDDRVWVEPDEAGRALDVEGTTNRLLKALEHRRPSVALVVNPVPAERTSAAYQQVLFLRQQDHQLDVYIDGKRTRSYTVATGTGQYPTPTGVYEVALKRFEPTWINPDPNGWGASMPAKIDPGPNNPLGLRALNWSGGGAIRFHGTAAVDSLGRDASHGCVRLSNPDVIDLYDRVDEGATIVSIR